MNLVLKADSLVWGLGVGWSALKYLTNLVLKADTFNLGSGFSLVSTKVL